jgi:ribosomal protein L19
MSEVVEKVPSLFQRRRSSLKRDFEFNIGDQIALKLLIGSSDNNRIEVLTGHVTSISHRGLSSKFLLSSNINGETKEFSFLLHNPSILEIKKIKSSKLKRVIELTGNSTELQKNIIAPQNTLLHPTYKCTFQIDQYKIPYVIGRNGSVVRSLTIETDTTINIQEDGSITIESISAANTERAYLRIQQIVSSSEEKANKLSSTSSTSSAFQSLIANGKEILTEIYNSNEMLSSIDIAKLLNTNQIKIEQMRIHHQILGVTLNGSHFKYPSWQAESSIQKKIESVLKRLEGKMDCWEIYLFLVQENPLLSNKSPIDALRQRKFEQVRKAAEFALFDSGE